MGFPRIISKCNKVYTKLGDFCVDDNTFWIICHTCQEKLQTADQMWKHVQYEHNFPAAPNAVRLKRTSSSSAELNDSDTISNAAPAADPLRGAMPHLEPTNDLVQPSNAMNATEATKQEPDPEPEQHTQGHTRWYTCDYLNCGLKFKYVSRLESHQLTHGKERLFACEFCSATFKQPCNLSTHRKNKHGMYKSRRAPPTNKTK